MAEKKAVGHAYNIDFLNVVFAASSIFLFLTTVWMVWADFDREWKGTQRRFNALQIEVTNAQLQQTEKTVNKTKLQQLQQQLASAHVSEQTNKAKIDEINGKLKEVDQRLFRATQAAQFAKARYDVDRYAFEVARDKKVPDVAERQKAIEAQADELHKLNLQLEQVTAERTALNTELGKYTGTSAQTQKDIDALLLEQTRLQK